MFDPEQKMSLYVLETMMLMLSANVVSSYKYLFLDGGHPEMTTGNSLFYSSLTCWGGGGVEDAVAMSLII
jgi:hypothetical protein